MDLFLVGGAVRDRIMGLEPHDFDFTVVTDSFEAMKEGLITMGVEIFQERPEFGTIRGRFPKAGDPYFYDIPLSGMAVDFVWARKEGPYSDGRHPDFVEPGSLYDDLARRDFTMNAIAMDYKGLYIDPFSGSADITNHCIRAVGNAKNRFFEDALRVVRALRFSVTKGFGIEYETSAAMKNVSVLDALQYNIATDRVREEMHQMFKHDTIASLNVLHNYWPVADVIFRAHGVWLRPTTEER